jgi:dTDP-glucose 4,6-dehydratase
MTILVTGGAGFIGSNFVLHWLKEKDEMVVNLDALTYAGNTANLTSLENNAKHILVIGDVQDRKLIDRLLARYKPRALVHFAAASHVDRSIHNPDDFIRTNIYGTYTLLEAARHFWGGLDGVAKGTFRFLHVSTDEVYGSLEPDDPAFSETAPFRPNSPYSASKAASDHLVRAWHHTYGFPTLTTNCSNNYGPRQFPEKLIPLVIANALAGTSLPIYGDGMNVRDWLYVGDHCTAISAVLERGVPGEVYNIGGHHEMTNLTIVKTICALLDELRPDSAGSYARLITFVKDRPGHDRRYAIDAGKIGNIMDWRPSETFESGIKKTVLWNLAHQDWVSDVRTGAYQRWIDRNYETRA